MVTTSEDEAFSFTPQDLPVAKFYHRLFEGLGSLGIEISLNPISFDLDENTLDADTYHRTCNQGARQTLPSRAGASRPDLRGVRGPL